MLCVVRVPWSAVGTSDCAVGDSELICQSLGVARPRMPPLVWSSHVAARSTVAAVVCCRLVISMCDPMSFKYLFGPGAICL